MRQFIAECGLDARGMLVVEGEKFHYLCNVLRVVPGDMIAVRLPDGTLQQMTSASVDRKQKKMVLQKCGGEMQNGFHASALAEKSSLDVWLFQFIAKPAKMELIVRQAVECGVSVIVPVIGAFSQSGAVKSAQEAASSFGKNGRWDRVVKEAREQSGSAVETTITNCCTVQKACELWRAACIDGSQSLAIALYEQTAGTKLLHEVAGGVPLAEKAALAVGAEGGISPEEIAILQKGGFVPVHFATNILRCETAALYGIAALQTVLVEKRVWQNRE